MNCDRGKHDFGRKQPFCLLCGSPAPRCVTCGRKTETHGNGSTRCVKGHTFRLPVRS